ncbi:unnamed protein product [Prorocentrum cordatum]|uniref:Protein kinase domain-containing protein n=1 Tax=Prorocentrum cordatum TaxID=2364126 RepID=A0ABN9SHI9_9DINO|nr:unnamed protein product [Polarella glacialis]
MVAQTASRSRSPRHGAQPLKVGVQPPVVFEGGAREDTWAGRGLLKKQLHVGCTATLKGLSVQRNGQSCVVEAFIRETGKWRVRLQGSGQRKELKPDHLILESHAEVAPPYDSAIEGPRAGAGAVPGRASEAVRPEAEGRPTTTLAAGRRVTLQGLRSAVELNGQGGVLEVLIPESGRWRVKLDGGQVKDLKPDNLVPQEAPVLPDAPESVLREAAALEADLDKGARWEATPGDACGPGGRFVIEEMLGEGVFSTVFRCRDARVSGMAYAVKFTRSSERTRKGLEREIRRGWGVLSIWVQAVVTRVGGGCTTACPLEPAGCIVPRGRQPAGAEAQLSASPWRRWRVPQRVHDTSRCGHSGPGAARFREMMNVTRALGLPLVVFGRPRPRARVPARCLPGHLAALPVIHAVILVIRRLVVAIVLLSFPLRAQWTTSALPVPVRSGLGAFLRRT